VKPRLPPQPWSAAPLVPHRPTLARLRAAAHGCKACPLGFLGTRTVFGEGPVTARVVLVGEQPGDREDREGRPFIGPAGALLDKALAEAGIPRGEVYVTNAVKHFKWEPRGKRRIHKKPSSAEQAACRPWLDAELALLDPDVVVVLGATAAQALLGKDFRVTKERGRLRPFGESVILATVHPSSILRAPDERSRHEAYAAFVADLKLVATPVLRLGKQPAP
jgi:uracil-DNA glycosylase family protein